MPEVTNVFPQDVLNQYQLAPGPKFPPVKFNVAVDPWHIDDGLPVAELAPEELPFTVTVTDVLPLMHCNTFQDNITWPFPN